MKIHQFYNDKLSQASYIVCSDDEAAVIDPLIDPSDYLHFAAENGCNIIYILETHFHADFVSGHQELHRKTGAPIIYGPGAIAAYEIMHLADGEEVQLGKIRIRAIHTPGHTPESVSFALFNEKGAIEAVFTGDTLFAGDVGIPDVASVTDIPKKTLAEQLFHSIHQKLLPLPDTVKIYPGHGGGSPCGKAISDRKSSTVATEKQENKLFKLDDEQEFVKKLLDKLDEPPKYFRHNASLNRQHLPPFEAQLNNIHVPLDAFHLQELQGEGVLILDARHEDEFAEKYIPGSLCIGYHKNFPIWVGSLIHWDQPLALVAPEGKEEACLISLLEIGYTQVKGYLKGGIEAWDGPAGTIAQAELKGLKGLLEASNTHVLDVRTRAEYCDGHLENAVNIPLASLPGRLEELDQDSQWLVHCGSGYRAMMACSILLKHGFEHVIHFRSDFHDVKSSDINLETCNP